MRMTRRAALWAVALLAGQAGAFTQGVFRDGKRVTPPGHEWLTVRAVQELTGEVKEQPGDPRRVPLPDGSPFPRAAGPALTPAQRATLAHQRPEGVLTRRYGSRSDAALGATVGQRWVDVGGFDAVASVADKELDCWNAVAQLPDDLQRDHFCRQRGDEGGAGAVKAIEDSARRFEAYFVDAVIAPAGRVDTADGGEAPVPTSEDRRWFLLGRALHLFQDSFSLDHSARVLADGFRAVRGIKAFHCTIGSDQHSHVPVERYADPTVPLPEDSIWRVRGTYTEVTEVRGNALAALEGTKDVLAAFLRASAAPPANRVAAARAEARGLTGRWLAFDPAEVRRRYDGPEADRLPGFVKDVAAQRVCDRTIGGTPELGPMERIARDRARCLHNLRPAPGATEWDAGLHIPLRWERKEPARWLPTPEKAFACIEALGTLGASTAAPPKVELGWVTPGLTARPEVVRTFDFAGLLREMSGQQVDLAHAWNTYTVGAKGEPLTGCASEPSLEGASNFLHPLCPLANTWFGVYTVADDKAGKGRAFMGAPESPRPESMLRLTELDQKLTVCISHWGQPGYTRRDLDAEFRFEVKAERPERVRVAGREWLRLAFSAKTTAALPDVFRTAIPEGWFFTHVGLPPPAVYRWVDPWYPVTLRGETLGTYVACPAPEDSFWAVVYYNGAELDPKLGSPRRNWTSPGLRDALRTMAERLRVGCERAAK